jgi:hypothetical protein
LFTGWGEDKDTYRGLHTGEDMCGVLPDLIFYDIVRKRNFTSSQFNASAIHPHHSQQLTNPTVALLTSVSLSIFIFIILYIVYTFMHHPRTPAISKIEVNKCRMYLVWKRKE